VTKGNRILIVIVAVIFVGIIGGYAYISIESGLDSPLSVIMSRSMQQDNEQSQIGVIDTGDVMVIEKYSKAVGEGRVYSYVEGTINGYRSFNDYGSVIIYERNDEMNPVIHRAIVWLNYNGDGTWSVPSFEEYRGQWTCVKNGSYIKNYNKLSGILTFIDVTQSKKTVSIDLDKLGKQSGYLTMGDNPVSNSYFDQLSLQYVTAPIGSDQIKSVAIMEIPWMGVIKVYMTEGKKDQLQYVPNSINCLIMLFVMVFALIYCCDIFYAHKRLLDTKSRYNEIYQRRQ
jgi:signal peptidase